MSAERPFRASDVLSRDEIRALTRTSNAWGVAAIAWSWLVIAASFAALARWPHPATFVAVVIVLGGRQLALAVLMHEGAHGTLFRTRALNERLVDWLCARPVWSDVARYRRHHLQHHAHTGTERDPDLGLALARPMTRRSLRRKIARDLVGATGLKRVLGLLLIDAEVLIYDVGGGGPRKAPWRGAAAHAAALARNLWRTLAANAAMLGALYALGCAWVYTAWIAAYLTSFSLFVRVRSLAEHACMERGADPLLNTRTTRASLLARITVAPLHVNLHLEHHLLPTVPWYRLPALGRMLAARGAIPARSSARDYAEVLRAVSAAASRGAPPRTTIEPG
jgi:fatty acid desaturase